MTGHFDLTQSPFHLLSLSVRADRQEVVDGFEEALADGRIDEDVLARAQQAVLTPLSRLIAELSWLPSIRPSLARDIVSNLEVSNLAAASAALERLQGVDKANLAADLCARSAGQIKFVYQLLEAYECIASKDILATLKDVRTASGFPIPNEKQVNNALTTLRKNHAKAALSCVVTVERPGETLTAIVEAFLERSDGSIELLLDLVVRDYDTWSQPYLSKVKERIESTIANCKTGGDQSAVDDLVTLLTEWDTINQPVQLLDESKGHEEPRSKEIYGIVRDFCVWLANENGQYDDALAISRALLETFPELPAVAAQLSRDVDALEELAEQAKSNELMQQLIVVQEAIQARMEDFDVDAFKSGFGPTSRGLAKKLYDAFSEAAARTKGTDIAEMPWMVVHQLAIELNNKHHSPEAACLILEGLISHKSTRPSRAVLNKLKEDLQTLRRNLKWEELKRASGDVSKGIALASSLLEGADMDERATLLQIKKGLERKKARTARKRAVWGLAAAALAGFLLYEFNKPQSSPRPSPTTVAPLSTSQPSLPPDASASPQFEERIPAVGTDRVLQKSEVRYCIFQGERLDILRDLLSGRQETNRFNNLISDYNTRCSRFRYREGVLQSVEAEVPDKLAVLRIDVRRLLSSWREAPASSTAPSTSSTGLLDLTTAYGASLVQERLKRLGYYSGAIDGLWGPKSRAALRMFKSSQGDLGYDGAWDLKTQEALMSE